MKKFALIAALTAACFATAMPRASAQTAMFTYTGVPLVPLNVGDSFTIGVNIVFTAGGNIANLAGYSYWMAQYSGTGFPFAITNRDVTGSIFNALQSGLVYPQIMDPINRNPNGTQSNTDLGAIFDLSQSPQPDGTYFVAMLTFSVGPGSGTYTLGNTTSSTPNVGGRISTAFDDEGDGFAIASSPFTVTVVPEPSTFALLGLGLVSAGAAAYRRRSAKR